MTRICTKEALLSFYIYYFVLISLGAISIMLIEESRLIGERFESFFGLREGEFYHKEMRFHWVVSLFQWPFLLFLVGWETDTPNMELDFVLTAIGGVIIEIINYFRKPSPKLLGYRRS